MSPRCWGNTTCWRLPQFFDNLDFIWIKKPEIPWFSFIHCVLPILHTASRFLLLLDPTCSTICSQSTFGLSAIRAVEFWCQAMSYSRRKLWQCDWPNLEKGRKNCHALQSLGCSGAEESLGCFVCGSSSSGHCGHTAFA